jgi:hypothetical protein
MEEDKDYLKFVDHMLRGARALDSLYSSMDPNDAEARKLDSKKRVIQQIISSLDTLSLALTSSPSKRFRNELPNNAYFMNFRQYQSKQDTFADEWRVKFDGDLRAYISYLSSKYPFL